MHDWGKTAKTSGTVMSGGISKQNDMMNRSLHIIHACRAFAFSTLMPDMFMCDKT